MCIRVTCEAASCGQGMGPSSLRLGAGAVRPPVSAFRTPDSHLRALPFPQLPIKVMYLNILRQVHCHGLGSEARHGPELWWAESEAHHLRKSMSHTSMLANFFSMMLREAYDLDLTVVNRACLPSLAH